MLAFAASRIGDPIPDRDCRDCPEMIDLPAGAFRMGGLPGDRQAAEQPAHEVRVDAFAIGRYEISFAQWDRCAADGGCAGDVIDQDWGRGPVPAFNVGWDDAQDYVRWLSTRTGRRYRLPSEAEWEYAARGGLEGATFAWGDEEYPGGTPLANFWQGHFPWQNTELDGFELTSPVGSFPPNGYGLYDMTGNAWEWTSDYYSASHGETKHACCAPQLLPGERFPRRVIKGGSHLCAPSYCLRYRPAARQG
ncbi:MAG: formylglycine-generating enzyme family protein, partial [Panacagrimonas sp.]